MYGTAYLIKHTSEQIYKLLLLIFSSGEVVPNRLSLPSIHLLCSLFVDSLPLHRGWCLLYTQHPTQIGAANSISVLLVVRVYFDVAPVVGMP